MSTRAFVSVLDLTDLVNTKVNEFVFCKKPFTVFDITKMLRDENPQLEIMHREVRIVIDSLFRTGQLGQDYTRTSTVLQSGQSAFVFHDQSQDSTTHPFADNGNTAPVDDSIPTAPDVSGVLSTDTDIVEITKESRLNIPQNLLRSCSMNVGDDVYLLSDNLQTMVLTKQVGGDGAIKFEVNSDGSVRIAQTHFVKKYGTPSQFYEVFKVDKTGDTEDFIAIRPVTN